MAGIKNIDRAGNNLPKEVAVALEPFRRAIKDLSNQVVMQGDLRASVLQIVRGSDVGRRPAVPPGTPTQEEIDAAFAGLRELTLQAQREAESLREPIAVNASMAFEALGQAQRNLADILGLASDLSDQADDLADQALDILNLATDVDLLQTTVGDLGDDFIATSTLLSATVSRVDATEDSIDVITADITSLQAELIDTTAFDPGIVWQFEGSLDGWTSNFTLTTNDYFISVPDDAGAYARSPSGIGIDGRLFTRIIARIRRTSGTGWLGRATYATAGGSAHGIDTTNFYLTIVTEPIFAGGGWVIVSWDMEMLTAGGTDWVDNIIDQIQLELSDDSSTEFDIDWVAIGRVAPSFFSGSLSALTSRVTATEDAITAISSDVTSLESRATDLEGDVDAVSTAVDTLSTRVDATEDSITTQSSQITSLSSRVDDTEDDITSTSTALTALTTRVTSTESVNTSQAASITSLSSGLTSANTAITTNATAISALDTRVGSAEGVNTSQSTAITALQTTVNDGTTGVAATATALGTLTTRVTAAEGVNTSQATSLTSINAAITNATTGLQASADGIDALEVRVSQTEASASQVSLLSVRSTDGGSLINPLNTAGNNTDWDDPNLGILPPADIALFNVGGRNRGAARLRTSGNLQRLSRFVEMDPTGIYEIRFSILKNLAHGYMYLGLAASSGGNTDNVTAQPVVDRVITGGPTTNNYFFFAGTVAATTTAFAANTWYDFVFYILGPDAPIDRCPKATINGFPRGSGPPGLVPELIVDGFKLGAGARFFLVRALNFSNAVQTDMYLNQVNVRRVFGRDAGIDKEISDRIAAVSSEQTARISGDSANATAISTVSTTVAGQTSSISTLTTSVNGLNLQWAIRLDNNGRISGIKLAGSNTFASFSVVADLFSISLPSNAGITITPFVVGLVNGVATVGINGNLVVDGTIITRNLIDLGVTTPKMAPQSVSRNLLIQAGAVNVPAFVDTQANSIEFVTATSSSTLKLDWSISINRTSGATVPSSVFVIIEATAGVSLFRLISVPANASAGEIYPGFVRREIFIGLAAGTFVAIRIRVINNTGQPVISVNESMLYLEETQR